MILSKLYRSVSLWKCKIFMFQVEPASCVAPLARRLRHTAGLLLKAAPCRGEMCKLPSLHLGTMLGSAPRLRRRRAELVALKSQASHSGVTWGGEGGRWLTHLVAVSYWTLCIDDLLVQLLGTSLQLVVVFHNKAVELQSVGEIKYVTIWCHLKATRQLLTKGPVFSSCKIVNIALSLNNIQSAIRKLSSIISAINDIQLNLSFVIIIIIIMKA